MPFGGRDGVAFMDLHVPKAPLLTCLTCPLCHYLIREATTISECLHTFCRECITVELSHGESDCCPVCQVTLGTLPLEKLRADHQLNDLKEKLFPSNAKKRKPGVSIGSPGTSNAARRKERSLYSLGVKGPPAVNPGYASRKTRALPNAHGGSSNSSSSSSEDDEDLEDEGDDDDDDDDDDVSDDSPITILKLSHNGGTRRASPDEVPEAKVHPHSEPRRRASEDSPLTPSRGDGELQLRGSTSKLSHRMAQTLSNGHNKASGSLSGPRVVRGSRKSNGSSVPARAPRATEFPSALDALAQVANADAALDETGSGPASPSPPSDLRLPGKALPGHRDSKEGVLAKGASGLKDSTPATANGQSLHSRLKQTLNGSMDRPSILRNINRPFSGATAAGQSSRSSTNGIWFHLESGDVQASEDALPPLSSPYVRIKDGKLPVFLVKTYLVQKLAHKVKTEMEVEITCRGQPVVSSLPLESIRDIWFSAHISDPTQAPAPAPAPAPTQTQAQGETSTAPANGWSAADFPTAKDFLMVLTYRRHRKLRIN